jgi:8-amino-7-oxononanoate synthase
MTSSHAIEQRLSDQLLAREQAGALRKLTATAGNIDFCSNDYLGLARNEALHQQINEVYQPVRPVSNGATGSRLISGHNSFVADLETELATLFQAEQTLLFNSGYSANTAILSAIPQKRDTILYDEYIHASLKEGARLSFANRFAFRHNDLEDLERRLQKATGEVFVVAESVYSMDGDAAPLLQLLALCEQYKAHLIWDEAHSTGIWGTGGSGLACEKNVQERIFARIYTFGKAMGLHGACIAGSAVLITYLINFARPFIYTTALPLHSLVSIREAFRYVAAYPEQVVLLHQRIRFFRELLEKYPRLKARSVSSESAIQVVQLHNPTLAKQVATQLQQQGLDVRAILSPTVKEGQERLRICLHIYNSEDEIRQLVEHLAILCSE